MKATIKKRLTVFHIILCLAENSKRISNKHDDNKRMREEINK